MQPNIAEPYTMAADPAPKPAGLPSPRSPTLSCADMILPESSLRSFSPSPYMERPPSPPNLSYPQSNRSKPDVTLASAPARRREPSPQTKSPPLSSQSSRSTLRNMGDSAPSLRHRSAIRHADSAFASSPTIADALPDHASNGWSSNEQRRLSNASSSVHSEDLESLTWPAFDGPGAFDDSGVALGEEEEHGQFPGIASPGDDMDNDRWLENQSDGEDEAYSSAALSRRAEMILANAKKRLNVMEGNLRGARQSLVVSPTLSNYKMESALSHQLAAARDLDRRLYAGQGPIPPRLRSYNSSPLASTNSPGHSRGMSETSVPVPFPAAHANRTASKRASSAMGVSSSPWSPGVYGQGRFPIRESRSLEAVRDPRSGWGAHEERDASLRSYDSRDSRSPSNTLETLPEDEDGSPQQRPSSATTDLRAQMQDLKGRISSLKQRAKEENMRRQSLQSLRTPSPFTCAETWYANGDAYKTGKSPVTADAGVGIKTESPVRKSLYGDDTSDESAREVQQSAIKKNAPTSAYHEAEGFGYAEDQQGYEDQDSVDLEDNDFVSVEDDGLEPGGDSVYEDALYEMPVTERHEDRVDAFDYEHFFLHSAMGSYSSGRSRSSSNSSADSVETTRPATASYDGDIASKRVSMHQRNPSVDSVSTVATFATAAEEQSDEEEENEKMDQFSQQLLSSQQQMPLHHTAQNGLSVPRSDSVINLRKANASPGQASRGSSPGGDLASGLQTSKIYTILLEATSPLEPRLALSEEEKQLIYGLAASFQQVSANLQSTAGDQYERKEWRRRLDEARRVLNGEELDAAAF